MLAVPASPPGVPPAGEQWVHEVKWDGVRLLAETRDGSVRLTNRTEIDVTAAYPEIVATVGDLPDGVLFDGEVIALDGSGRPTLQAMASRMHVRDPGKTAKLAQTRPVTYMIFDLLRVGGRTSRVAPCPSGVSCSRSSMSPASRGDTSAARSGRCRSSTTTAWHWPKPRRRPTSRAS
jgi:ATP-dependent DNA ligase